MGTDGVCVDVNMVGTWMHGVCVDVNMVSTWMLCGSFTIAALHYGGAFARRARRVCGLNGSRRRKTRCSLHARFCGATSGRRAKL